MGIRNGSVLNRVVGSVTNHGWGNRSRRVQQHPFRAEAGTGNGRVPNYAIRNPNGENVDVVQRDRGLTIPIASNTGEAKREDLLKEHREQLSTLGDQDAYRAALRDRNYFKPSQKNQLDTLESEFQKIMDRCPEKPSLLTPLAGSRMLILASAASRACNQSHGDAARALALLGNLDLMQCLRDPDAATVDAANIHPYAGETRSIHGKNIDIESNPCPAIPGSAGMHAGQFMQADLANAWRIAQTLAETPVGFALLREMTATPATYAGQNDAVQEERGVLLRAYLNAAREKIKEAGGHLEPDPRSIHQYLRDNTVKEAQDMRHAACRVADAVTHEATRPNATYEDLEMAALARNMGIGRGITSDDPVKTMARRVYDATKEAIALAQDNGVSKMVDVASHDVELEVKKAIAATLTATIAYLPDDASPKVVRAAQNMQGSYDDILKRLQGQTLFSGNTFTLDLHDILPKKKKRAVISDPLVAAMEAALSDPKHCKQIAEAAAMAAGKARPIDQNGNEEPLTDLQELAQKRIKRAAALASKTDGATALDVFNAVKAAIPDSNDDIVAEAHLAVPQEGLVPTGTLLDKALLAITDHAGKVDTIAERPENKVPPFTFPEQERSPYNWAIHAVKCGIYTDAEKDAKGKPTLFGTLNGYMSDVSEQLKAVAEEKQKKLWNPFKRRKITPFRAYDQLAGKDGLGLDDTLRGSLHTGREIRFVLITELAKGLLQFGAENGRKIPVELKALFPTGLSGLQPALIDADPPETTLRNLVRLNLLNTQQVRIQYISEFNGVVPLGETELERMKATLYSQLDGGFDGQSDVTKAHIDALCNELNVRLTVDELMKWIADVPGAPQDFEEAMALQDEQRMVPKALPNWARVGETIALVVNDEVNSVEGANPDGTLPEIGNKAGQVSPDEAPGLIQRAISGMTQEAEADTAVWLHDGRTWGVNITPAIEAATFVRTGGAISAGAAPYLRGFHGATYSNDTGVAGSEQYSGRRNDREIGVNGRVTIGTPAWGDLREAASLGLSVSRILKKSEGAMIRDQRPGEVPDRVNPWEDEKGTHNELMRNIADMLFDPENPPPGIAWALPGDPDDRLSPLKMVLHQGSSVNLRKMEEKGWSGSFRLGWGLSMGSEFLAGSGGFRFNVNGEKTKTTIVEGDRRTVGGGDQKFKTVAKSQVSVNVAGMLGPLSVLLPEIKEEDLEKLWLVPQQDITATSTPGISDLLGVEQGVHVSGKTVNFNQLVRNGTIRPNSYYTEVFETLQGFIDAVYPNQDDIALDKIAWDKAQRTYPAQWKDLAPTEADRERAERCEFIRELFLTLVENEKEERGVAGRPTYWKYNEMNPELWDELTHLESQAVEFEKVGNKRMAKICRDQFEAAKKDPEGYINKLWLVIKYPNKTVRLGPDGLVTWQNSSTAVTSGPGALF